MSLKAVCDFCGKYEPDGDAMPVANATFIVQSHLRGTGVTLRWDLNQGCHAHPRCLALELVRGFSGLTPFAPWAKAEPSELPF